MQKEASNEMINTITIWDEYRGENHYNLIARIDENGDLILDGGDIGLDVKKWWGDIDYEYWYNIKKAWKDTLLLYLLAEKFTLKNTPQGWFENKGIPFEFSSYI